MIDSNLQAQLRLKFNPDGSDLRKMQLRMLDMLKYIDGICRENNIRYWLSSGTCLGAVRHGGFIPWDDDVDIEMEKKDFKKLKKVLKLSNCQYQLQDHSTDNEYLAPYAKLRDTKSILKETNTNDLNYKYHGLYIDIFCMSPSSSLFLFKVSSSLHHRIIYRLARIKNKILRKILINTIYPLLNKVIYPLLSFISGINNKGYYRHIHGSGFVGRRYKEDFEDTMLVPFEDTKLPIPKGYDKYLKRLYGDYMTLPAIEDIHPHISKIDFL